MLPKEDRKAMLLRLYNEDTPLMDHSKDRFHSGNAKQVAKKEDVNGEPSEVKLEDEAKDEVKEEMNVKAEGEEGDLAPASEDDEDVDGGVKLEREDDVLDESMKEKMEDEGIE